MLRNFLKNIITPEYNWNWPEYFKVIKSNTSPREVLLKALPLFELDSTSTRIAIDLGCGTGADSVALLKSGWSVLSIDGENEAINYLLSITPPDLKKNLSTQ